MKSKFSLKQTVVIVSAVVIAITVALLVNLSNMAGLKARDIQSSRAFTGTRVSMEAGSAQFDATSIAVGTASDGAATLNLNPASSGDLNALRAQSNMYALGIATLEKQIEERQVKAELNRPGLSAELRTEYFSMIKRLTKLREALLQAELNRIEVEFANRQKAPAGGGA